MSLGVFLFSFVMLGFVFFFLALLLLSLHFVAYGSQRICVHISYLLVSLSLCLPVPPLLLFFSSFSGVIYAGSVSVVPSTVHVFAL